jgi:DNA-binding transcriptional LysR family regulator
MLNAAVPLHTEPKTTSGATATLRLVEPAAAAPEKAREKAREKAKEEAREKAKEKAREKPSVEGRSCSFFTPTKLEAFVAVAEEGGFSAAARRLCISQPALSQTINAIEHRLGVELFARSTTGVQSTAAGRALLDEARAILARYDQLLPAMARYVGEGGGVMRLGIPYELPPEVLDALAKFALDFPDSRVQPRHLPMAEQLEALRSGRLDVSFTVQIPPGPDLDHMLVAVEELGVLLSASLAARLAGPDGVRLDALAGLEWVAFPRANSPAWYDELAATLRTHGIDVGPDNRGDESPHFPVTFTALSCGDAFALAPRLWAPATPHSVVWCPLADHPMVRRTWAVWPASSRRRDVARLITTFEQPICR